MSEFSKDVKKEIKKEIKKHWGSYIWDALLTLFFIIVAKKIELQINFFGIIYWYVASLLLGHLAVNTTKDAKKLKYNKHKLKKYLFMFDAFVATALVGAVNLAMFAIPILLLDYFFNILGVF